MKILKLEYSPLPVRGNEFQHGLRTELFCRASIGMPKSGGQGPAPDGHLARKKRIRHFLQELSHSPLFGRADKNQRPASLEHFLKRRVSPAFL